MTRFRPRLSSNEAVDPNCAAYHTPRADFKYFSPVSYAASLLVNMQLSTEIATKKLKKILRTYPAMLSAKHHGRCLWSHACINRPDIVKFLLQFDNRDYPNVPTLPLANAVVEESGNGLLMAPVSLAVISTLASNDFIHFCSLLRCKNETHGGNFFHYHSSKPFGFDRKISTDTLFWLSEFWKKTPTDRVTEDTSLPDVNLMNKMLKTPLQLAIECNNPGIASMLIFLYGAFWFKDCLVASQCPYEAPIQISYMDLAKRVKSEACIAVLEEAEMRFRINSNTSEQNLRPEVICSICTDGKKSGRENEWYLLSCGHALHCTCLMSFCASCSSLCCPECRCMFEETIISKAPQTVYRIKYAMEGERDNSTFSREVFRRQTMSIDTLMISSSPSMLFEHSNMEEIFNRLRNNGVQVVEDPAPRISDDNREADQRAHPEPPPRQQSSRVASGPVPSPPIPAPRSLPGPRQRSSSGNYGGGPSATSSVLFHALLSTIRSRAQSRDSKGQSTIHDRYLLIVAAAETVANGFSCVRNPTPSIDPEELYRRLESSNNKPSYQELFGDAFRENSATDIRIVLNDAFTHESGVFYTQIHDDARMAEGGIAIEDIKRFEEDKLIRLFNCLYRFLCVDFPLQHVSIDFCKEMGVLIADAFDGSLNEDGLPIQIPGMFKKNLSHYIESWVLLPIIVRYQCNALTCMDAYIENQMTLHGIESAAMATYPAYMQQRTAEANASLANAMKSQWLTLHSEHHRRRSNISSFKHYLANFMNDSHGVCKKGAESLLNLVIYTCNVML